MNTEYSEEVEKLLHYGYTDRHMQWPNYVHELNLKEEHAEELIEILSYSNLSHAISGFTELEFGPRHVWRALGQLQIVDAVDPLLNALVNKRNEEAFEYQLELPKVLLLIGTKAIPKLEKFLKKDEIEWNYKLVIVETLVKFALKNPGNKKKVIEVINNLLLKNGDNYTFNSRILNEIFKLAPVKSKIVEKIIRQDKFDFGTIHHKQLLKFLEDPGTI